MTKEKLSKDSKNVSHVIVTINVICVIDELYF